MAGYRSLVAFWMGGVCSVPVVVPDSNLYRILQVPTGYVLWIRTTTA